MNGRKVRSVGPAKSEKRVFPGLFMRRAPRRDVMDICQHLIDPNDFAFSCTSLLDTIVAPGKTNTTICASNNLGKVRYFGTRAVPKPASEVQRAIVAPWHQLIRDDSFKLPPLRSASKG